MARLKVAVNTLALVVPDASDLPQEVVDFLMQLREIIYTQQEEIISLQSRVKVLEP